MLYDSNFENVNMTELNHLFLTFANTVPVK